MSAVVTGADHYADDENHHDTSKYSQKVDNVVFPNGKGSNVDTGINSSRNMEVLTERGPHHDTNHARLSHDLRVHATSDLPVIIEIGLAALFPIDTNVRLMVHEFWDVIARLQNEDSLWSSVLAREFWVSVHTDREKVFGLELDAIHSGKQHLFI